jgi:hypothetical protein
VTWRLKAGIVEPEEMSVARQQLGKQVSSATDTQATIEELLRTIFSVRFVRSCNKRKELVNWCSVSLVEAGSNTSTVNLRIVGGDEKRTQGLGV